MADRWHFILVLAAALGSGLVAGVFYAFSTFVMRALAPVDVESAAGVEYWQRYGVGWTRWNHVPASEGDPIPLLQRFRLA